jgi:predicted metal-dependent enzyme (double-stranded beta helix superfamily)
VTGALTAQQLAELARSFASDPSSWAPHVREDAERRACHRLLSAPNATVWLLCWMPGQNTGFHDHDGAAGVVTVVRGRVFEERLRVGGPPLRREAKAGQQLSFGESIIHCVGHAAGRPAVTIHAYSPALRRMGAYDFDDEGELRRRALDEDVELGRDEPLVLL